MSGVVGTKRMRVGSTNAWVYIAGREWHSKTMTTRDDVVRTALGYNGTCDGQGYDGPNPFSADLSRPAEAWCGDFVTDVYKRAQIPLPSMQPGCQPCRACGSELGFRFPA